MLPRAAPCAVHNVQDLGGAAVPAYAKQRSYQRPGRATRGSRAERMDYARVPALYALSHAYDEAVAQATRWGTRYHMM
jgi:hypothetical protein